MTAAQPYIFLSYSKKDSDFTRWLNDQLQNAGFETWLDVRSIPDGSTWVREIERGVRECGALVTVTSKQGRQSEWVERETILAMQLGKPVFAALIDDVQLPIYLVNRQYTDFRANRDSAARQMIAALRRISLAEQAASQEAIQPPPETDENNFFAYMQQLPDGDKAAKIARELYEWALKQGATVVFSGWSTPLFQAKITLGLSAVTVFSVWAYSRQPAVQITFQYLQTAPPYDERQLRLSTLDALNRLLSDADQFPDDRADGRPGLPLVPVLAQRSSLTALKRIIKEVIDNLRDQ